jgi:hypothetical protein
MLNLCPLRAASSRVAPADSEKVDMIQMPRVLCERFTEALCYAVAWDTIERIGVAQRSSVAER